MKEKLSINKLNELVSMAKDLNEPFNYFFDMLDSGMLSGDPIKNVSPEVTALLKIIEQTINKQLNLNTHITKTMLEQTSKDVLIHGIAFLTDGLNPLNILYVDNIKTAIVMFHYNEKVEVWRIVLSNKPHTRH